MAVFEFAEGGAIPSSMRLSGNGDLFPVHLRYHDDEDEYTGNGIGRMADGGMPSFAAPNPFPQMSTGFMPYAGIDGLKGGQPQQIQPGLVNPTPPMVPGLSMQPPAMAVGLGSYGDQRPSLGTTPQQNSPYTLGSPVSADHTAQAPAYFAKGGLTGAAHEIKKAGRYGDTEIIHVNKEELEELKHMWGEPTINPETGQPEFFLKSLWKAVKKIAPIAALFIPVIGPAVGSMLAGAAGAVGLGALGTAATATAAATAGTGLAGALAAHSALIGSALTGATLGGANGGLKGAVIGGLTGGLAAPSQVAGGLSTAQNIGQKYLGIKNAATAGKVVGIGSAVLGNMLASSGNQPSGSSSTATQATPGAPAVGLGGMGYAQKLPTVPNYQQTIAGPANSAEPFRVSSIDYSRPGFKVGGGVDKNNEDMMKHLIEYSRGGGHMGPGRVKGIGSGQEDKIPAWLSDGEYVWSAQDVADLGDGSTDDGVRKLDKMRQMVRQRAGRKDIKKIAKPQRGIDHILKAVGGVA